jgi:hypothetical protein
MAEDTTRAYNGMDAMEQVPALQQYILSLPVRLNCVLEHILTAQTL